jgi:hypothetical protein
MQTNDEQMNLKGAVDEAITRAVGIAALVAVALIHILQLPDAFDEIGYLGALFIGVVVASVLLAAALTRTGDGLLWAAVGGFAGVVLLGYIISRSVGLPGFTDDIGEWTEPLGLASMVAEGLIVCVSTAVLVTRSAGRQVAGPAEPAPPATRATRPGPALG